VPTSTIPPSYTEQSSVIHFLWAKGGLGANVIHSEMQPVFALSIYKTSNLLMAQKVLLMTQDQAALLFPQSIQQLQAFAAVNSVMTSMC